MTTETSLRRRLRRPDNPLERTRWLFLLLVVGSVLVLLPPTLASVPVTAAVALTGCLVLTLSTCRGYLTGRATWTADIVDMMAIGAFTMSAHKPDQALGLSFATVWLRATYSSRPRSLVRCGLYEVAMTVGLLCWPLMPGNTGSSEAATLLGVYPVLAITVTIVSFMMANVLQLAESGRRDAAMAKLGSDLLGEADAQQVYARAGETVAALCAATPGLRIIVAVLRDGVAEVVRTGGAFAAVPAVLDLADLEAHAGNEGTFSDTAALDAAAGTSCSWVWLSLPQDDRTGWMIVGGPPAALNAALNAARSTVAQVALAVRSAQSRDLLVVRASTDTLTGLANRASFADSAVRALAQASGSGTAALFIDLDDFKHVNDGLGHAAGDALLRTIAERLVAATRGDDICARLGGDEFAVLLTAASVEAARATAERLVEALGRPVLLDGQEAYVAASIGVAHTVDRATSYEELVQQADVAMYAAKAQGKRRVQVYTSGLLDAGDDAVFSRSLAAATAKGEMEVHYQPVLDLHDGHCTAVEALVRWRHPQRGLLAPAAFIDEAERTGAIREIGAFVLQQACGDVAAWRAAGHQLALHVNVSVAQLIDDSLLRTVQECLAEHDMAPGDLVLEITESMVLDAPSTVARLHALAAAGVRVAVDDFGTGYAALTVLRQLPASIVKIDRSFVAGAADHPADLAAIEAIMQMARRLGLQAIAEGVEDLGQHRTVLEAGATSAQGYMYARPASATAISEWLAQHSGPTSVTSDGWVPSQSGPVLGVTA